MINNVELVSDIQQSDSVIHIHESIAALKWKDMHSLKEKL